MPRMHQNDQGKPTTDRGKAPHKGGYHARYKPVNPFKIWFETTNEEGKIIRAESNWNPGKRKKK